MRKLRITLALVFLTGITLLFIGIGQEWWGWMAKLQVLPSCLAGNTFVIASIALLSLIFGRIYCSVICPLGVFQDVVIRLRRILFKKKPLVKHFEYSKEHKTVRFMVLAATIAAIFCHIQLFVALIEPYSNYGRIVSAMAGTAQGSVVPALLIASAVVLVLLTVCAWLWGRAYCNTVCPVGTLLGTISRISLFKIRIDTSKCRNCGRCVRSCKSSCIDMAAHSIDHSRCVDCFDCIGNCREGAISYSFAPVTKKEGHTTDKGRRAFLLTGTALLGSAVAAKADGGLATIIPKEAPAREGKLVPPGAGGEKNFYSRCTACQLCVRACPNGVLRPSTDAEHLLQPEMSFEKGFCRPECTACSDVCPSGAITRLKEGQKLTISIGVAVVNTDACMAAKRGRGCGNCAYHCPSGAISMGPAGGLQYRPVVNEQMCIGCGKCEYLCPISPISAITVKPRKTHRA